MQFGTNSMKGRAVHELPVKLLIVSIIMITTASVVVGGLSYYSSEGTEANARSAVQTILNQIVNVYTSPGTSLTFDMDIKGAGWGRIDHIKIGDRLDPSRPTDNEATMQSMIQWSAGQHETTVIESSGGASIVTTSAGRDDAGKAINHGLGVISPSSSNWSMQMTLHEGHYTLGVAALAWDADSNGEATETFVLIYPVESNPVASSGDGIEIDPVSSDHITVAAASTAAAGSLAGIVAILCAKLERFRFAFFAFMPLSLVEKEDNYTRGLIKGAILVSPGAHLSMLQRTLGLSSGTLVYHLQILTRRGEIKSETDGQYRRFYPAGWNIEEERHLTPLQARLLEKIESEPGITTGALASATGASVELVIYHVRVLRMKGLARVEKSFRQTRCYPESSKQEMETKGESQQP